jgi:hypothetical protein
VPCTVKSPAIEPEPEIVTFDPDSWIKLGANISPVAFNIEPDVTEWRSEARIVFLLLAIVLLLSNFYYFYV